MTLSTEPKIDYMQPCAARFGRKKKPSDIKDSNVLVGLSTSQDYHKGNGLLGIVEYILAEPFNAAKFLPAGILERYNLAIENASTPEEMKAEAKKLDNQWRKNNRKTLKKIAKENIYDWETVLTLPTYGYQQERELLQTAYNENEHFRKSVIKDAQAYLKRKKGKACNPVRYETEEAIKYAIDYKLEELTVFKILAEKEQFHYFAYPGKCPAAVNALFTDILNIKTEFSPTKPTNKYEKEPLLFKWFGLELYEKAQKLDLQVTNNFRFFNTPSDTSPKHIISRSYLQQLLVIALNSKIEQGITTEELNLIAKVLISPANSNLQSDERSFSLKN